MNLRWNFYFGDQLWREVIPQQSEIEPEIELVIEKIYNEWRTFFQSLPWPKNARWSGVNPTAVCSEIFTTWFGSHPFSNRQDTVSFESPRRQAECKRPKVLSVSPYRLSSDPFISRRMLNIERLSLSNKIGCNRFFNSAARAERWEGASTLQPFLCLLLRRCCWSCCGCCCIHSISTCASCPVRGTKLNWYPTSPSSPPFRGLIDNSKKMRLIREMHKKGCRKQRKQEEGKKMVSKSHDRKGAIQSTCQRKHCHVNSNCCQDYEVF